MCKGYWEEISYQWFIYKMSNDIEFYVSQSSKSPIFKNYTYFFVQPTWATFGQGHLDWEGVRFIITDSKCNGPLSCSQGSSFKRRPENEWIFSYNTSCQLWNPTVLACGVPASDLLFHQSWDVTFPAEGINPPVLQGNGQSLFRAQWCSAMPQWETPLWGEIHLHNETPFQDARNIILSILTFP